MSTAFHPVHAVYDGIFNTVSGVKVDLLEPTPEMFKISDIANALSNLCRFGGHTSQFYSVAQHSCLVASLAPDELKREALMHDAAEAYLGDVIKPLKVLLGDVYENLEDSFMQAIAYTFGLDHANLLAIKPYDRMAVEMEQECYQKGNNERIHEAWSKAGYLPLGLHWHPIIAGMEFRKMYDQLFLNNISIF